MTNYSQEILFVREAIILYILLLRELCDKEKYQGIFYSKLPRKQALKYVKKLNKKVGTCGFEILF